MTINQRTLMRMPLKKIIKIAEYWGIRVYDRLPLQDHFKKHHRWKRWLVNDLIFEGYDITDMKSDFGQWRRV